jgi:hypothetical protein
MSEKTINFDEILDKISNDIERENKAITSKTSATNTKDDVVDANTKDDVLDDNSKDDVLDDNSKDDVLDDNTKDDVVDDNTKDDVVDDNTKDETIKTKSNGSKPNKKTDDEYAKEISSLTKALNDTRNSYQKINQKNVLTKRNYLKTISNIKENLLNQDNVLLDEEEYNKVFDELNSIFNYDEEELNKEQENSTNNKTETIYNKLENQFNEYCKYNKSKDLKQNYEAFFAGLHLLSVDEKEDLAIYLEEAEPIDAVERVILVGKQYRDLFEEDLKKHKNIYGYVASLKDENNKLKKTIADSKKTIDKDKKIYEDKPIYARHSQSDVEDKKTKTDLDRHIIALTNSLFRNK